MNNLTADLLYKHYNYDVEEWVKQGSAIQFNSGKEQRIVGGSIPAIEIQISYRGLSVSDYQNICAVYESNHSNTFILDLDSSIDLRPVAMTLNSSVWAFKQSPKFSINARENLYSGSIILISSVFFNFTAYQSLYAQSSAYTVSSSVDDSFLNLLDVSPLYQVDLSYQNNLIFSSIGQSIRHQKDKNGLKRYWTAYWILTESQFIKVLTYYRKKSGIMGEFGMPIFGKPQDIDLKHIDDDYIENQDDYVYLSYGDYVDGLINARFVQDSLKYIKRVDGLYATQADIMEVKQ